MPVEVLNRPYRIGQPRMQSAAEIQTKRAELKKRYGSISTLRNLRGSIGLNEDERIALRDLENFEYLEGD